jgi:hypothetical protein
MVEESKLQVQKTARFSVLGFGKPSTAPAPSAKTGDAAKPAKAQPAEKKAPAAKKDAASAKAQTAPKADAVVNGGVDIDALSAAVTKQVRNLAG